jgi:hypothetical protein
MLLEASPLWFQGLFVAAVSVGAGASVFIYFLNRKLSYIEFLHKRVLLGGVLAVLVGSAAAGLAVSQGRLGDWGLPAPAGDLWSSCSLRGQAGLALSLRLSQRKSKPWSSTEGWYPRAASHPTNAAPHHTTDYHLAIRRTCSVSCRLQPRNLKWCSW